ncbi:MAG: hypothetical protein A2Z48_00980 [Actinobacteria bacterium RBG_19FT_COMBO_70_19]|nr:MAG: hypothetical protein A2Z48_00980 [Actinobacteria bacterium RBG_19FT_COMBO_70_19]
MRHRALTLVVVLFFGLALAPIALAGPDPHGHGGGKGDGGGKPSPSPTATSEPSPSPEPSVSVEPERTATESPSTGEEPTAAPTEEASPGNGQGGGSGVVKLDRAPFDQAPNNEPHVGCTFQIDLYNYPEGGLRARYTFFLWPPTGHTELKDGSIVLDDDAAGGGRDLDAETTVELGTALIQSGVEPHHHNGWHVKLVVRARHSSGPDQKQKVFWVRECKAPSTTGPPTTTEPPTTVPTTVTPPSPVAFTGGQIAQLGALGLLALVLGSGALWLSARLRREAS